MKLANRVLAFLDDRYNQAFLVVLLMGILLRLKYFFMESIWNDASVHLWYAIKMFQKPAFIFTSEFLAQDYVIPQTITAIFYLFTQNVFIAGKFMALLYSMVGIIFMYLLGSELKDKLTGIVMAILFTFSSLFWFYSVRPLSDAPVTVMFVVVAYCVLKLEKEKTNVWATAMIATIFAAMLTKMPAILLVVSLLIYAVVRYDVWLKDKVLRIAIFLMLTLLILGNVVYYILFRSLLISSFFKTLFSLGGMRAGFDILAYLPHLLSWYVIVLFLIGLILILLYRNKNYYYVLLTTLVFWLYFELGIPGQDRYVLPLVPLTIAVAAFGLVEGAEILKSLLGKKIIRHIVIVLVVILICFNSYSYGTLLIDSKVDSYLGYQEAGAWVKDNVPENAVVFVGSPRSMRAFAERETYNSYSELQEGGMINLRSDRYLDSKAIFENDLNLVIASGRDVYVEIDVWEYTQPGWYFPLTQDSMNYFSSLGFVPAKLVEREVTTQSGIQNVPVIFILKYQ